jgi:membrane fusion protein (multidrug efflux system)
MKYSPLIIPVLALLTLILPGCHKAEEKHEEAHHKILATNPVDQSITITEPYVCQIHSRRHIDVRALEGGYLEEIPVKEGQAVKQGDLMFKILSTLYQAKLNSEIAEAELAQIEFNNTTRLFEQNVVSDKEVALAKAKLAKASANVDLARAERNFADVKAPFDGIIDRLYEQQGSLIEEGDKLTTLSDNQVMWVYFNVPEARYLEYKANLDRQKNQQAANQDPAGDVANPHKDMEVELKLADGSTFGQPGEIAAIEADFNNRTGNIAFRADFTNPDGLLRHGQTGTILIHRNLENALVIPQRATFEVLDKRYVFVVDKDGVVHQNEIKIENELEDIFVIAKGLTSEDKIVLEGVQQIKDGEKVECEFRAPDEVMSKLKNKAE